MGRLETARNNHISKWVLPFASRLLIEAACKDATVRPLDEVAYIEMGQSPSGNSCNQDSDGVLLIGGPADLGLKYPDATRWTNQPTKLCKAGDIIICVRATIGEPRWADGVYCLGRGVAGLRPLGSDLDSRFLFRIIEGNEDWLRSQGTGTTFKTISKVHLARIKVPIIPKDEQQQISSFLQWLEDNSGNRPDFSVAPPLPSRLSDQRRIVAKVEALAAKIEEARRIKRETEESAELILESAITEIFDNHSKDLYLGDDKVAQIIAGQHILAEDCTIKKESCVPYLTGPADFGIRVANPTRWTEKPKVTCKPGDILVTVKGAGVGKTNIAPDYEAAIGRQVMAIRPTKSFLTEFIYYFVRYSFQSIKESATATTVPGVKKQDVERLRLPKLPVEEQHHIVAYLDALQAQVDALKKLQAQTAAELNALLPAILDRAVKGEL